MTRTSSASSSKARTIAIIITLVGMAAGAAVWASGEHMAIKDWTAEQDYTTKKEVQSIVKAQYVPREDFVELKTDVKYMKKQLQETDDKVSEIHNFIMEGRVRSVNVDKPHRTHPTRARRDARAQ